jgi:hypothetical protein
MCRVLFKILIKDRENTEYIIAGLEAFVFFCHAILDFRIARNK